MSPNRLEHQHRSGQRAQGSRSATAAAGSTFWQPTRSLVETGKRHQASTPKPELKLSNFLPGPQLPDDRGGLAAVLALPGPTAGLHLPVTSRRAPVALPPRTRHQGKTLPASSPVARSPASQTAPHPCVTRGDPTQGPRHAATGLPWDSRGPANPAQAGSNAGKGELPPGTTTPPGLPRCRGSEAAGGPPHPTDRGPGRAGNFGEGVAVGGAEDRPGPAPLPVPPPPPRGSPGPPDPRLRRTTPAGEGEASAAPPPTVTFLGSELPASRDCSLPTTSNTDSAIFTAGEAAAAEAASPPAHHTALPHCCRHLGCGQETEAAQPLPRPW